MGSRYKIFEPTHPHFKRGYIDDAIHWGYSSARDYEGIEGLIEMERFW